MSQRPLFDPRRVRPPEPPAPPPGAAGERLTVRQVNELVRQVLEIGLPPTLHVVGEIGNLTRPSSGHVYFTLKDGTSELRCVMWRSDARKLRFAPEGGLEVIATGAIEVYPPRGSYQLMVRQLEPRGMGALELALRQLRDKLTSEGLFDEARKRPLPRVPERVAVVTSPTGAAVRDIIRTMGRRWPPSAILVAPVRVQGAGAAEEIAAAITRINAQRERLGGIDVLIVGRGGGALEDLWAFNEEIVARAIFASEIPVVSAVGHEVDFTIADFVADVRAATPTAAAELVTPDRAELREALGLAVARLERGLEYRVGRARDRLAQLVHQGLVTRTRQHLRGQQQRLDEGLHRLDVAVRRRLQTASTHLGRRELSVLRFGSGAAFARLGQRLDRLVHRLWQARQEHLLRAERRLTKVIERLTGCGPVTRLQLERVRLANGARELAAAVRNRQRRAASDLHERERVLSAIDPRRVLARGYSITRDARTRRVIRSVREIRDHQALLTELADGTVRSTAEDPRQPGLFDG